MQSRAQKHCSTLPKITETMKVQKQNSRELKWSELLLENRAVLEVRVYLRFKNKTKYDHTRHDILLQDTN